ncbi:MAG: hypothetical protein VX874_09025 [Pseudomonadota bacterium]|nr:hypothetical protein [Pseudomonadota bacterium]
MFAISCDIAETIAHAERHVNRFAKLIEKTRRKIKRHERYVWFSLRALESLEQEKLSIPKTYDP